MHGVGKKWGAGRSVGVHVCNCKNRSAATNIHLISASLYGPQSFFSVKHNFLGTKAVCHFRSCKTYSSKFPVSGLLICSCKYLSLRKLEAVLQLQRIFCCFAITANRFCSWIRKFVAANVVVEVLLYVRKCTCNSLLKQLTPLTVGM